MNRLLAVLLLCIAGSASAQQIQGGVAAPGPTVLKDFFTDAGNILLTGETDLYSYTTTANRLSAVGQKFAATYGGVYNAIAAPTLKVYFAGTVVLDTTGLESDSADGAWAVGVTVIRTGAATARVLVTYMDHGGILDAVETDIAGLTFSSTNILKITGQASLDNEIVAKLGTISWVPAGP